jgi:hypothetical protein
MWGILFTQVDREMAEKDPTRATATWIYPFRVSPPSQQIFAKAVESLDKKGKKTEFN